MRTPHAGPSIGRRAARASIGRVRAFLMRYCFTFLLACGRVPWCTPEVAAQETHRPLIWSIEGDRARVVFPSEDLADTVLAHRILTAVDTEPLARARLPLASGGTVTISLTAQPIPGKARSLPGQRLIIMGMQKAKAMRPPELLGALRHELAHIALGTILERADSPLWFHEGYAEYARGAPTCEEEIRLWVALSTGMSSPRLQPSGSTTTLDYVMFATAIAHLDRLLAAVDSDWERFLRFVGQHGFVGAMNRILSLEPADFESEWADGLAERYASTEGPRC